MQVNHSQRTSEKPFTPWIIAEENGKVLAGHCDCMAGLGETCSHVASLLFAIESGVRIRDSMTVTQKKAYWVMPNGVKEVQYAPVRDINFLGKKRSAAQLSSLNFRPSPSHTPAPFPGTTTSSSTPASPSGTARSATSVTPPTTPRTSKSPTPVREKTPTQEDTMAFLGKLALCKSKPAILSLVEPYSSQYVAESLDSSFPVCLSQIYKSENLNLNYLELLSIATNYQITVTEQQTAHVESKTRLQANSRLWFQMRAGRITASHFKSACRTNPAQPSISLIMAVCHPEMSKFKTAATNWGCEHEKVAISRYLNASLKRHHNFRVIESGFFICTSHPLIGASPDSLTECTCCSEGICEVKVRSMHSFFYQSNIHITF